MYLKIWRKHFHLLCVVFTAAFVFFQSASGQTHYPGITPQQDSLALIAIECVGNLDWERASLTLARMTEIEEESDLVPLSYLLMISTNVLRVQNDEFASPALRKRALNEIERLFNDGIALAERKIYADSAHATLLFIEGGIRGYRATLDIESSPVGAVNQAVKAMKCLDSALVLAPSMKDAYLGSGLFNCILAKYPRFLRRILGFYGKSKVNPDTGLNHLRLCAQEALYSRTIAKQYLIQFLSPYIESQAAEKRAIFKDLENQFPHNPYFLFLELDEALCFYPDSLLSPKTSKHTKHRLSMASKEHESERAYANIVKWQYGFIDSLPPYALTPNSILPDRPFSYYPPFVDACREKYDLVHAKTISKRLRKQTIALITANKDNALSLLKHSEMNPLRKAYYLWRIRDGCKIK
jgi:hypothetical protein